MRQRPFVREKRIDQLWIGLGNARTNLSRWANAVWIAWGAARQHKRSNPVTMVDAQPLTYRSAHGSAIDMSTGQTQLIQNRNRIPGEAPRGISWLFRLVTLTGAALVVDDDPIMLQVTTNQVPEMMIARPSGDQ